MSADPLAVDPAAMAYAKALLRAPMRRERMLPLLAAAVFMMFCALAFAVAMVVAPPVITKHVVPADRSLGAARPAVAPSQPL